MNAVASTTPSHETLNGIPPIDVAPNVQAALVKGRRATGIAAETAVLRFGAGKLSPQEYFIRSDKKYYVDQLVMRSWAGSRLLSAG